MPVPAGASAPVASRSPRVQPRPLDRLEHRGDVRVLGPEHDARPDDRDRQPARPGGELAVACQLAHAIRRDRAHGVGLIADAVAGRRAGRGQRREMDEGRRRLDRGAGVGESAHGPGVDRHEVGPAAGCHEPRAVKHRVAAADRAPPRIDVGERARDPFDAVVVEMARLGRRPHERPHGHAAVEQPRDDVPADESGGPGDQCGAHARNEPVP
jgi:hypothetical protein